MAETSETIKSLEDLMSWKGIMDQYSAKLRVFFILSLNTGLLISDLRPLRWAHFFRSKPNRTVNYIEKKYNSHIGTRRIRLSPGMMKALCELREENPADELVFQTERVARAGITPLSTTFLIGFLKKSAAEAGLKEKVGGCSLRKTLGYHLVSSGKWSLEQLTAYFGYVSPQYTAQYCDLPYENDFKTFDLPELL